VRGRCCWDFLLIPEEVHSVRAVFENLQAGQFPSQHENCWVTRDGNRILIAWTNTAILDDRGSVEHIISTGIDITERRQVEEELRKSEERFRLLSVALRQRIAEIGRSETERKRAEEAYS